MGNGRSHIVGRAGTALAGALVAALLPTAAAHGLSPAASAPRINFYATSMTDPEQITAGPDGALWFTARDIFKKRNAYIGRITTSGAITMYSDPSLHDSRGIALGADGALWFANRGFDRADHDVGDDHVVHGPEHQGPGRRHRGGS